MLLEKGTLTSRTFVVSHAGVLMGMSGFYHPTCCLIHVATHAALSSEAIGASVLLLLKENR